MAIDEVFPNSTVKQVIFQIRFPNLFYIENRIGDFQTRIMTEFPQSSLVIRKQFLLVDLGPKVKLSDLPDDIDSSTEQANKIWQFRSPKGFELNVFTNSLDITSSYHKTYNLPGADRFRDIIEFVLTKFFEVMALPIVNRIGLRYIDECPVPSRKDSTFKSYYNSVFPLKRFHLADAREMRFQTLVKRGDYFVRYVESFQTTPAGDKLILDFDAFAENIDMSACLAITDELHTQISDEYEKTIKEPVYKYMRQAKRT